MTNSENILSVRTKFTRGEREKSQLASKTNEPKYNENKSKTSAIFLKKLHFALVIAYVIKLF